MKGDKKHFFDSPSNVRRFIRGFFAVCALLLLADLFVPKHGEFFWENAPEFYAAFGLVACIMLVLGAKYILRPLMKRKEDYYDE